MLLQWNEKLQCLQKVELSGSIIMSYTRECFAASALVFQSARQRVVWNCL